MINYSTSGGCGFEQEWLNNMNCIAKEDFCGYYNIKLEDIDPKTFIIKMYKFLSTKYVFTITYEYLSKNRNSKHKNICRPNIFINGEFIFGYDWHNNKWHALQQTLIEFCNNHYHKLRVDQNYESTTKNIRDFSFENIF